MTALSILTFPLGEVAHGLAWWFGVGTGLTLVFVGGYLYGRSRERDEWIEAVVNEALRQRSVEEAIDRVLPNLRTAQLRVVRSPYDHGGGAA